MKRIFTDFFVNTTTGPRWRRSSDAVCCVLTAAKEALEEDQPAGAGIKAPLGLPDRVPQRLDVERQQRAGPGLVIQKDLGWIAAPASVARQEADAEACIGYVHRNRTPQVG